MFFFFFKQKTAYEIKECDWSSDVCSSDLIAKVNARLKSSRIDAVKQMRRSSERKKLGYLTQLEIMRN